LPAMLGPEVILLGRGERHLASGEPLDTPSPTEQQPLPVTDGRQGTASALASSEAEKDPGCCYRRGMRGGARGRFDCYALFMRGTREQSHSRARREVHLIDVGRRQGQVPRRRSPARRHVAEAVKP
jgi:hypothetical protein